MISTLFIPYIMAEEELSENIYEIDNDTEIIKVEASNVENNGEINNLETEDLIENPVPSEDKPTENTKDDLPEDKKTDSTVAVESDKNTGESLNQEDNEEVSGNNNNTSDNSKDNVNTDVNNQDNNVQDENKDIDTNIDTNTKEDIDNVENKDKNDNPYNERPEIPEGEEVLQPDDTQTTVKTPDIEQTADINNSEMFTTSETIVLDGQGYEASDFQDLGSYLTSANLTTPITGENSKTIDLMGDSSQINGISFYDTFKVDLTAQIVDSSSGIYKFWTWKFSGIKLEEELTGTLQSDTGTLYGNYYVKQNGEIYVVLNEEGSKLSVINIVISFQANWNTENGENPTIEFGDNKIIHIPILRAFGEIKEIDGDANNPICKICGERIAHICTKVDEFTAFEDVTVTKISSNPYCGWGSSRESMDKFAEECGVPVDEIMMIDSATISYKDESGEIITLNVPSRRVPVTNNEYNFEYEYVFETPIKVKAGEKIQITHQASLSKDFLLWLSREKKASTMIVLHDIAKVKLAEGSTVITSSHNIPLVWNAFPVISNKFMNENGAWNITLYDGHQYDLAGKVLEDTLGWDGEFDTSWFLYVALYQERKYHIVENEETFKGLNEDNMEQGIPYYYKNKFKLKLPDISEWCKTNTYPSDYYTSYSYTIQYMPKYKNDEQKNEIYQKFQESINNGRLVNHASVFSKYGEHKWGTAIPMIEVTNDGIHKGRDDILYTNYSFKLTIPATLQTPHLIMEITRPSNERGIIDKLYFNEWANQNFRNEENSDQILYTNWNWHCDPHAGDNLGMSLKIENEAGEDVLDKYFGNFNFYDQITGNNGKGQYKFSFCDKGEKIETGLSDGQLTMDRDEDIYLTFTMPMMLEGNSINFPSHTLKVDIRYKGNYSFGPSDSTTVDIFSLGVDSKVTKKIIGQKWDEKHNNLIYDYQLRYDMSFLDVGAGEFVFEDYLESNPYAKYIPGSAKVYWVKNILTDTIIDPDTKAPYPLEYYNDKENILDSGLATLKSSNDNGFTIGVNYNDKNENNSFLSPQNTQLFYSVIIDYQVSINHYQMMMNDIDTTVKNSIELKAPSGNVIADNVVENEISSDYLFVDMTERPDKDNDYIASYEVLLDNRCPKINELAQLTVVNEMSKKMSLLLNDQFDVKVLVADEYDGEWRELDESLYKGSLSTEDSRLGITVTQNTVKPPFYKITYSVKTTGTAGTNSVLTNKVYISGLPDSVKEVLDDLSVEKSTASADGKVTKITVKNLDANDISRTLAGGKFELLFINNETARIDKTLYNSSMSSEEIKQNILNQLEGQWQYVKTDLITDGNGTFSLTHNGEDVILPLNTLFKLVQVGPPEGYLLNETPQYFYLTVDRGEYVQSQNSFVQYFDMMDYETMIYVVNGRGKLNVIKIDKDSGEVLAGAKFGLYSDPECTNLVSTGTVYSDNTIVFEDLLLETTYYLKELEAPEGYRLDEQIKTVYIRNDGSIEINEELIENATYYFKNTLKPTNKFPDCGGNGIESFVYTGILLIAAGIILLKKKKN